MKNDDKLERIAEVARLYYKEGKSQLEIGDLMGVSHSTISRMLKQAHEYKVVEVFIRHPINLLPAISKQLETQFGLKKAFVVTASRDNSKENLNNLALQAANVLSNTLHDGIRLGISSGRTVAAAIQQFKITQPLHVLVVPLHGLKGAQPEIGENLVYSLADQLGRAYITLPSPWLMQTVKACQLITQEKSVSAAIQLAESADVALVGIGALTAQDSYIFRNGWINREELKALKEAGAVGEICGKFFNQDGQVLDIRFNQRVVSINLHKLKDFETVLGVAGSVNKANAILGALRGGLINVLVTDSDAARKIIELADVEK